MNVPADAAILHHYRICEFGGNDCIKTASTVDTTAFRYRDRLVAAVRGQHERLKASCQLHDFPALPKKVFGNILNIFGSDGKNER